MRRSSYGAPTADVLFPLAGLQEIQTGDVPGLAAQGYAQRMRGGPIREGRRYTLSETGQPEAIVDQGGNVAGVTTQPTAMTSPINGTVVPLAQTGNPIPGSTTLENPGGQPGRYNFMTDPGYGFRFDEGQRAIERSAAARGMGLSGSILKELTRYGQGIASQEYGNVYSRLAGIANLGQGASNLYGQAAMGTGQGLANAYGNIGSANAAGTLGRNSAYQGILGSLAYQYGTQPGATPGIVPGPIGFNNNPATWYQGPGG